MNFEERRRKLHAIQHNNVLLHKEFFIIFISSQSFTGRTKQKKKDVNDEKLKTKRVDGKTIAVLLVEFKLCACVWVCGKTQ